jgi:hypothetical protein
MKASEISETAFLLKKMMSEYSRILLNFRWPSEHDRWIELLFALVTRVTKKPESEVRRAIHKLDALDLVSVHDLAEMPTFEGTIDFDAVLAARIYETLSENPISQEEDLTSGFTAEEAKSSIQIMHEAAKGLVAHNDGKIQKYLRGYGEKMLEELSEHFTFSKLTNAQVRQAFAYWLQNVLNMPLILADRAMQEFCREHGISLEILVREADDKNLNIALLDDLIEQYISDREKRHGRESA